MLFRSAFPARRHVRKQGRFGVAAGGGALGRGAAIHLQIEHGKLPQLSGIPCLKLPAAEFANLTPAIGVAAYEYHIGLRHVGRSRGVRLRGSGCLQAVQEIGCALRVGCGGEDRALVVFQDLDPRRDIGGVVFPNLRRKLEVGAKER